MAHRPWASSLLLLAWGVSLDPSCSTASRRHGMQLHYLLSVHTPGLVEAHSVVLGMHTIALCHDLMLVFVTFLLSSSVPRPCNRAAKQAVLWSYLQHHHTADYGASDSAGSPSCFAALQHPSTALYWVTCCSSLQPTSGCCCCPLRSGQPAVRCCGSTPPCCCSTLCPTSCLGGSWPWRWLFSQYVCIKDPFHMRLLCISIESSSPNRHP